MCYSNCLFENHLGDCRVKNMLKLQKELDVNICSVGGNYCCFEEEEFYTNIDNFEKIKQAEKIIMKNLY